MNTMQLSSVSCLKDSLQNHSDKLFLVLLLHLSFDNVFVSFFDHYLNRTWEEIISTELNPCLSLQKHKLMEEKERKNTRKPEMKAVEITCSFLRLLLSVTGQAGLCPSKITVGCSRAEWEDPGSCQCSAALMKYSSAAWLVHLTSPMAQLLDLTLVRAFRHNAVDLSIWEIDVSLWPRSEVLHFKVFFCS